MPLNSTARRSPAALIAVFLIAGACTSGGDKPLAPVAAPNAPALSVAASAATPKWLVISQVYGGGGNSGATIRNDFIELYNGSVVDVSLTGWSVQYASSAGASWQVTPLTGTIRSGQYYLVQESQGAGGTVALVPDASGTIAMSATAGKVALVNGTDALSGGCPTSQAVDFVGFGSAANCFEGSGPTATLSNTTATLRKLNGQQDTDVNSADFATGAPAPRNSATALRAPLNQFALTIDPSPATSFVGGPLTFTASATQGGVPTTLSSVAWTSSKPDVATIDGSTGVATPVALGTTTIAAAVTSAGGSGSASTTLTITGAPQHVTISPKTWTLKSGLTKAFTASAVDALGNAVATSYAWSSADPSIAVVDANGVATGRTSGTAQIIAAAPNGPADTATITVTAGSVSISSRTDVLPVGFQTQLFVNSGSADSKGAIVTGDSVVWSSSNPAIVSVNPATGVITATGPGTATIRATAKSDGISAGSAAIVTEVEAVSADARTGHNTELGVPSDADPSDDLIIARRQYTLSYNVAHGGPNWVSWNLDASHQGGASRCNCFTADTALTRLGIHAFDTNDWINGGVYSRGHMSPSADWADTPGDNAPTFFLSNMIPQNQTANSGAWGSLENYLRTQTGTGAEIYIIAGPIFTKNRSGAGIDGLGFTAGSGHIAVPDSMWKVAVIVPDTRSASQISATNVRVIAVKMANDPTSVGDWSNFPTTIDKIQQSTGYDLLSALPPNVQCRLETRNCIPAAHLTGSGLAGGDEGATLSFSAATSSDADPGDVLSYAWSIDGQPAGTQSTLSHSFADNGDYAIRVIVADPSGAADTASATVHVANVAPTVASFDGATILQGESYSTTVSFTDPGADTWRASANYGDGSATVAPAISNKSFDLEHQYTSAGSFAVVVEVLDKDGGSGTGSARVIVQTPQQGIANLASMVASLGGARGSLNKGQLNSLQVKLDNASQQLDAGNGGAATNMIQAFLNELDAVTKTGRASDGATAPIVEYAQRVIASIGG
ncbi:MAG: DNA/RNA non-specific endonuclease [Gemmatimonadaceae bacterium]